MDLLTIVLLLLLGLLISNIVGHYIQRFNRTGGRYNDRLEVQKEELRFKVLDAERSEMRRMYEAGEITSAQEKELRRFTNYIESIVLYDHNE